MTIDDESSIYGGGIPYDASEDSIRRVKIINDRRTRGKCYGFVTFTNPRSAIDAMEEMDGRTIGGRVVRVNGVRTRGGRLNFDGESFRHDFESGRDWDRDQGQGRGRDRDRERDYDHNQERYRDRSSDRLRDRDWSRDYDREGEKGYNNAHYQARDSLFDRDRDKDRDLEDARLEHSKNRDPNWERDLRLDSHRDREMHHDKLIEVDRDQFSRKWNGDQHSRDFLSNPNDDSDDLVEELRRSIQRLEEINKEILQKEERLEEKGKLVLDLQQKSKKLEDALINAKKISSYRNRQLTKLHKSFLQVQEYTERLRTCEKERQSLVDAATLEEDLGDDALRAEILSNGNIA